MLGISCALLLIRVDNGWETGDDAHTTEGSDLTTFCSGSDLYLDDFRLLQKNRKLLESIPICTPSNVSPVLEGERRHCITRLGAANMSGGWSPQLKIYPSCAA